MGRTIIRRITVIVGLFLAAACCEAQSPNESTVAPQRVPLDPVEYDTTHSFIIYDSNHLYFSSDTSKFAIFARKWHEVTTSRKGIINIVQIGASHVQGGTFPHRIRRNFLLPYSDFLSDRGMIFPYSAAVKCNNPFDYKVLRTRPLDLTRNVYKEPAEQLGLCGIAVTAADSAAEIKMKMNEPELSWATNEIVLLGESRGGVMPQLRISTESNDSLLILPTAVDKKLRRYTFQLPATVDSFSIVLQCDSGQAFAVTGVYMANGNNGISFHSIGVNGASLNDYLRKCPYFTTDLQMLKPDMVIFGIGINDASGPNFDTVVFKNSYLQLVDSVRSVNPDCVFVFVTNNDSYKKSKKKYFVNNNGELARQAFYRIAEETGGAVWDQFAIMGGLRSMETWYKNGLAQRDRVHFSRAGYELLGDMLSNAIFEALRRQTANLGPSVQQPPDSTTTNRKALYKGNNSKSNNKKTNTANREDERPAYILY